jgi:tRNA-specific 2-thiouridylase
MSNEKKALIAMSGGVDSSVAAALMKERGYDVIGITMKLFSNDDINISATKTCCSLEDINDARRVAAELDMPYYVLNFTDNFKEKVIDKFIFAYEHGATPNPCIDCNRFMKFDLLYQKAKELGYNYVVTGHYARIEYGEKRNRYLLKKAVDLTKDQSYVLYSLTQEQLGHTIFPLGDLHKTEVRELAEKYSFVNAKKQESQDICFVPDGDYAKFIEDYTKRKYNEGYFVDKDGNVLGKHKGIIHYTIGQRRGLGLVDKRPLYVCDIRPCDNTVVVGYDEDAYGTHLDAANINLILEDVLEDSARLKAKIRYNHKEDWAIVRRTGENSFSVDFEKPQRAITKGQAVVLYDGDTVVGGGTIS